MTRRGLSIALVALAAFGWLALLFAPARDFLRGYAGGDADVLSTYDRAAMTRAQRGALYFTAGDFGALNTDTLETHAIPWRLAAAALVQRDVALHGGAANAERLRAIMTRFGFLYPETIVNWPGEIAQPRRTLDAPLGFSMGVVKRDVPQIALTTANLSCASCHAGHSFDRDGEPMLGGAYLGAPNTSLDLEAYTLAVYDAFKAADDSEKLFAAMIALFPDTSEAERATIRNFVWPRVKKRMAALRSNGDRPLPFVNGAPGLTNGVAALKMQLGRMPNDPHATLRGFTSIPDLGARRYRTVLLYDGAYAPPGATPGTITHESRISEKHLDELAAVTAFFTVPSMGVKPEKALDHIREAEDVFRFLKRYEAPRFPGKIDAARAQHGRELFAARCASCHGEYDESVDHPRLIAFPNWQGAFDTDPERATVFGPTLAQTVQRSAYGEKLTARATGQYAAPLLTGLWLSAPYLHNGSVPTLWDLMHAAERPARFLVGGHRLNYERMGIDLVANADGTRVYPDGYAPWSRPALIDTTTRGLSNVGHAKEFDGLGDADKRALLEYLKLL